METKTDLVSIGMPVYNGANYIKEALESLLSQDYGNFELIISDNASTDSTQSICLEYLEKDSRIKYFRNQVNEGGLANFNKVLELSSGKYFMWAAHDDLWEINYITELVKLVDSDPNNVLAFSCLKSIDMNSSVINSYPHIHFLTDSKHCVQLSKYITAEEYLGKANLIYGLMRKDKIQEIGGLTIWGNTDFGSDMLFVFRLLGEGRLVMSSEFLFFKRIINNHVQTASNSNISFMSQITQSLQELNLWIDYFQGYLKIITIINVPDKLELYLVTVLRALRIVSRLLFSVAKKMIVNLLSRKFKYFFKTVFYKIKLLPQINQETKLSYSQCGEDLIIKYIFDGLGIVNPSYLDIGAYHPYRFNNTAIFYSSGATGINIEPDPDQYQIFLKKRKFDLNLNIGVSDISGEMTLNIMSVPTLTTFSQETANNMEKEGYSVLEKKQIRVKTISEIIETYCDNRFPDLLSIDVEGLDERIIKSIDFSKSKPIVICVETISFSNTGMGIKNTEIIDFLEHQDYIVFADTNINTIFVRKDLWRR